MLVLLITDDLHKTAHNAFLRFLTGIDFNTGNIAEQLV